MSTRSTPADTELAAAIRGLGGFALGDAEASEAARNLAGFVAFLAEIDRQTQDGGIENAGDGSGHRVRQAEGRADRVRQRRSR
jgi:hypothetical protein